MGRPASDKRERVVRAATEVVYARGFHASSLADIARRAEVPVGSVYYFFKTKEQLGEAVIDGHLAHYETRLLEWEQLLRPEDRLDAFLQMTLDNKLGLSDMGCPVATLTGELRKEGGELGAHAASVFGALLGWLSAQFTQLGSKEPGGDAEHLLAAIEGATLLTHSFSDPSYVEREAARLSRWIRARAAEGQA